MYYVTWGWPVLAALAFGFFVGRNFGKFAPDIDQNIGGPLRRIGLFIPVLSIAGGFVLWLLTQRIEPYKSAHWAWVALPAVTFLIAGICAGLHRLCTGGDAKG